jgi:hypothetical protein
METPEAHADYEAQAIVDTIEVTALLHGGCGGGIPSGTF